MIQYFHRQKNNKKIEVLDEYKSGTWVYAENPTITEIDELAEQFTFDRGLLYDATDEDEMPRMQKDDHLTYIFTRFPTTNEQAQIVTSPILFVVAHDMLLTLMLQPMPRLDRFLQSKIDFSTTSPVHLLLQILDEIDDEYASKLSGISRQIKVTRSRLRIEEINNRDFVDFVLIEDLLNEFLSALVPTNSILKRLLVGKHLTLHHSDEDIVEDLMLNNEQSIEACKSTLKTIVNIRESYATIMTNNLNRIIRLLTVLTVILSIPTLISSVYGMNVRLPFERSPWAFTGIMLVSLLVSVVLLVIFRIRRWL